MSEPHLQAEQNERDETAVEDGAEEAYAFPLSFAQRRLWFLQQLEPSSAAYNVPFAARLLGRLDAPALERALNEIVRRHEILRTTFELLDEEPAQIVNAPRAFALARLDLGALAADEREESARRLASEEALRPFDLTRGPLLRAALLRLCDEEHVLLLTLHHIVADGWSIGVLVRELSQLYAAYLRAAEPPLEELPIQYADFAVWQRETVSEEVMREQLDYWKKALAGAPPLLELPIDRPRPPVSDFEGAHESFVLPRALVESLARLGRSEGATLQMTLLAAFQVLLARYTGQEDVLVGVPAAGRQRREVEGLIGFFVNTLVLRADLRGRPSFREALRRVRDAALGAYAHQDIPFEALVEALRPERLLNHTPLFQVMFNYENTPDEPCRLEGLTLAAVETESETARFDLTLEVAERDGRLHCALRYRSALFEAFTIRGMAERLRMLLEAIVADASLPVWRLPLSSEEERRRAIRESGGAARAIPAGDCVHHLFEAQAARTPDATALVSGNQRLTYAEVNREANRLAHHLRQKGLRAEETTAVLLERSARYVIAMLAVLKAGGAYVPLDPQHPPTRLGLVMADARAKFLITERRWRHVAPTTGSVVCLEDERRQIEACEQQNPRGGATAENLAYVIYTSGSTGKPKGVAVEHRQLANYLHAVGARLRFESGESYAVVSTLAADLGYTVLWPALCGGGLLHVLPPDLCADAAALGEYFHEHNIDCLKIVPSHLEAMLAAAPRVAPLPRKHLVLGGERTHRGLFEALRRLRPPCVVHNHYGPTETTVGVLTTPVEYADADATRAGSTLGRPLDNTAVYVLDAEMRPAPKGLSGELYVGGAQVARGYVHAAAATAAAFVPDAFSAEPGARLYKTGDLARRLADGRIEFLGRADNQLKVRGFRIELGEIESVLRGHAAVREAVVLAREVAGGERRLEAYVVTRAPLSVAEAREFLRSRLPEASVPSSFVFLDTLPLNANGKLDRRALLAAAPPSAPPHEEFAAPRDLLELQLCRVWEEVLGVQPVGVRSNFFDLGGHSLLGVRLVSSVERATGRRLPLSALFDAPTVEMLAALLRDAPEANTSAPLVRMQPRGSRRAFFCVHAAGGSVFPYVMLARRFGNERPFYGLQARGADGVAEPATSLEEMAADYLAAVRAVQKEGPYLLGGWSLGGSIAFEMARQLQTRGEAASLILLDAVAPGLLPAVEDDDDLAVLLGFALQLGLTSEDATTLPDDFSSLGREEQLALVFERTLNSSALPPGFDRQKLRHLLRLHRAGLRAARSYRPAPLPLRLTLLRAESPPGGVREHSDPTLGWQSLTTEPVELCLVPGDHFTMLRDPHVATLALRLAAACAAHDQRSLTR